MTTTTTTTAPPAFMKNLGKANVRAEIISTLPGIEKNILKYNFDILASQWEAFQNSAYFKPLLTEYVADTDGSFAALFPSKRKFYVNNFIKYGDGTINAGTSPSSPYITWTPTSDKKAVVADIFSPQKSETNPSPYDDYNLIQPQQTYPEDYIGPKWSDASKPRIAPTNDTQTIITFLKSVGAVSAAATWTVSAQPNDNKLNWVNQHTTRDGLWWGIESSPFIGDNMPLWINMKITQSPPSSNHETKFIISLGMDDESQAYDIILSQNNKPLLYDYYAGRSNVTSSGTSNQPVSAQTGNPIIPCEFDVDLSRILDTDQDIEIGVMTIAGRLIIWVNQVYMIYTRMDKSEGDDAGVLKECRIAKGKMRIYGTNVQAAINVCPMTFSPMGVFALPLPAVYKPSADASPKPITYKGVHNDNTLSGSVGILPQQPDKSGKLYGVDCNIFTDPNESINPSGFGFHQKGKIIFASAFSVGITVMPDSDYYMIIMRSYNTSLKSPDYFNPGGTKNFTIPFGGCPYFFRIKGGFVSPPPARITVAQFIPEVIDASESSTAPDYFHALTNATVTIYNKGGQYDFLKEKQYGIKLYWGWGTNLKQTFTGVITSVSTSETPGMETLTLQCEDYMFILKNTPIINSPFYDGMVAYYAIADLAKRGGILNFVNDMQNENDYFLPSGYTFTAPVMKFPSSNMIFQCMMAMLQRFESFIYFDAQGSLHINRLPGGLFSESGGNFAFQFSRNPDQPDPSKIILDERNVEWNYASTVNKISIMTIHRDTREAIIHATTASPSEDHLLYKRIYLGDQAALGDLETCRMWTARLAQRIYWPIRKTSFSTVGSSASSIGNILDFIKVDSLEYRITSLSRKYSAGNNDFTNEYGVEWLGGK